jgi:protein-disulfide isomerase
VATKKSASSKASASKPFGLILIGGAILGIAALGYVMSRQSKPITLTNVPTNLAASGVLRGNPEALVQVIEFADFECPGCGQFATVTEPDVMSRFVESGEVSFRFMDFPLTEIHPNAVAAHNAAACSIEQGKFWPYHDQLFLRQHQWNSRVSRNPKRVFAEIADAVGLDKGKWEECYDSQRMIPQISANRAEGIRLRVGSTPTFIINDQVYADVLTFDQFRQAVTEAKVRALAKRSEEQQAAKQP